MAALAGAGVLALAGWSVGPAGDATAAAAARPRDGRALAKGRVIVGFEAGTSASRRSVAAGSVAAADVERLSPLARDTVVMKLPRGLAVAQALRALRGRPGVAFAERDHIVTALATSDDPYYVDGRLWGMHGDGTGLHANQFGSGAGEAWAAGVTGSASVFVGVLDEGIMRSHPDLAANMWVNPFDPANGIDDDGNGYVDDVHGWDFWNEDPSVYDGTDDDLVDEHGTHVAGTIGARGGNAIGVAGVNWDITIIATKFLGPDGGFTSDAIRALDYLTDLKVRHGLDIVATNNSWGGGAFSQALEDAINRAGDAGILFVAAAGNSGRDNDRSPQYPSSYRCTTRANGQARGWDCLIAVASIDSDGKRSGFSSYGVASVDLGAPGSGIFSTVPPGSGYESLSGTSMATPHVAGAVALCASLDPSLTARQLRDRVMETVRPTASMSGRTVTGGRLDVGSLAGRCAKASPDPDPSPDPPLAEPRRRVVDDLDAGFRRSGSGWRSAASGFRKHHYWVPVRRATVARSAAWHATLDAPGRYQVKVKIPRRNATTRAAAYRIKTVDGFVRRVRDQWQRRGDWVGLGIHRLGSQAVVRLTDKTGERGSSGRRVAFDAVRFIPMDDAQGKARTVAPTVTDPERTARTSETERPRRDGPPAAPGPPVAGPRASDEPAATPVGAAAVPSEAPAPATSQQPEPLLSPGPDTSPEEP